jgi:hypothetical protein
MNRRTFLGLVAPLVGALPARGQSRRRLLLRSSWQTVNIGDIAHTPGVLQLLAEHAPHVDVTLWPSNIGQEVEPMLRRGFPRLRIAPGAIGPDGQPTTPELRAAFADCAFLLHGSGPSLVAEKHVAAWREATGKPFGVYGITLAAPGPELRTLLDSARFLYLRDTVSLATARAAGLKCPVIEFSPDGAFAFSLRNETAADAYLKAQGLEPGRFVCAIPRLRYTPYWKIHSREMTAEDRRRHEFSEQHREADHARLREALTAFVRRTGMKVLICPEDRSHMEVGRVNLWEPLPADVRTACVWRPDYWLPDEAVSVYVRSLALLSMDMHSPIMAVGAGIPAIHCRFKEQTSKGQMWRDIGLGEWLFDLDEERDGARITAALLAIAEKPAAARARAAAARDRARRRQAETIAVVAREAAAAQPR